MCIYLTLPALAGYNTRSIFKESLTGLNSVFLLLDCMKDKRTQSALQLFMTKIMELANLEDVHFSFLFSSK